MLQLLQTLPQRSKLTRLPTVAKARAACLRYYVDSRLAMSPWFRLRCSRPITGRRWSGSASMTAPQEPSCSAKTRVFVPLRLSPIPARSPPIQLQSPQRRRRRHAQEQWLLSPPLALAAFSPRTPQGRTRHRSRPLLQRRSWPRPLLLAFALECPSAPRSMRASDGSSVCPTLTCRPCVPLFTLVDTAALNPDQNHGVGLS